MFLLNRVAVRGVLRTKNDGVFSKSTKLRNYVWSTLSHGFRASKKSTLNYCCGKLVSCNYSNTANEITQVDGAVTNVCEEGPEATEAVFEEIANGDHQVLRQLKLLQFEVEVLRQTDKAVPSVIKKHEWEEMLALNSMNSRKKYLSFLFKNERRSAKKKEKQRLQREEHLRMVEEGYGSDPLEYNLNNQTLLLRVYNKAIHPALSFRNELSEEIAQHIVFDCSYQEYMNPLNSKFCAVQLLYCLTMNLYHRYPCYIRLCNLKKEDYLYSLLPRYMTNVFSNNFPWLIHEESYLDIYPKDKLVYLTPHCNEPLRELNPGDIYIIGAFVDKGCGVKASLARAKENNLKMARLPLDEYITWKQGTKSLPLNIVLKILLDMKFFKNWPIALKNVPRRHYGEIYFDDLHKNSCDLLV